MKAFSLLVLTFFLVSCGGGGGSTKTKVTRKGMSEQNALIGEQGMKVALGTITTAIGDHILVICEDIKTTDLNTTNSDRARSLTEYKDGLRGMDQVEFGNGMRTDTWRVEWALNEAISRLERDLTGTKCPAQILGKQKI